MTIKVKLIAILVLMVSILCLISGYITKSYVTAQKELSKSSNAVFQLSKALETRLLVNMQVQATVGYILTGKESYREKSRDFVSTIEQVLQQWRQSMRDMGVESDTEDVGRIGAVERHYRLVLELEEHAFRLKASGQQEMAYALIHEHIRGVTEIDLNGMIDEAIADEMSDAQISYFEVANAVGAIYWVSQLGQQKAQQIWFALNDLLALSKAHFYIARHFLSASECIAAMAHDDGFPRFEALAKFSLDNWITSSRIGMNQGLAPQPEVVERIVSVQQTYSDAIDMINRVSELCAQKNMAAANTVLEEQLNPLGEQLLYQTMNMAFDKELQQIIDAHADLERYVHRGGIMGLAIIALLAVVITFFSLNIISGIFRSIRKLSVSTDIIRGGNLDHRIGIIANDEFGRLAKGFDEMTATLQRSDIELKELNRTLETRVNNRTVELSAVVSDLKAEVAAHKRTGDALKQAKLAAEAASEAKSMFLANMSHEIRTPLNGVIGMTGLLLDTQLTAQQRDWAETARTSGEALLTVINDILDYSKIEAGKLDLEIIDFDLRSTLEDMADMLAIAAHAKKLEFTCLVRESVPALLKGDPGRLRQILINLANNAIKFTSSGEVSVHVSLDWEDETSATIRFEVIDTGIGIPGDRAGALFDSFSQLDASTTRQYGGTGLGLAISKRLTEMMGGRIGVTSEEGKGSTFWFTLRLKKQEYVEGEALELPEDIRQHRIMIVDDKKTNREVLKAALSQWGCNFSEAENGPKALQMLAEAVAEKTPYHIALLDMQMPSMDGESLGVKIKSDLRLASTALIMITSVGGIGDAARLQKAGFAGYLSKPIKRSQLYDCLVAASRAKAFQENAPGQMITKHSVADFRKRKIRILVAEDNVVNQKVIQLTLHKLGYRSEIVGNGEEAVHALELAPYDMVFMDVQMPEMDGLTATRIIRDPSSAVLDHDIPIVAITAHAMKGDREKCIAAGMDDYIPKPIQPQEVLEMVEKWGCRNMVDNGDLEADNNLESIV